MNDIVKIKNTNICTRRRHPEDILSNCCGNDFCFDDVQCGCMESFLQSLKFQDPQVQRKICLCKVYELERYSIPEWNASQPLWWKGRAFDRYSAEYMNLLYDAYTELYLWCARFRDALMGTVGKRLSYDSGATDPGKTVLTDKEFYTILTRMRRRKLVEYKVSKYPRRWPNSYGVDEDYEF